MKKTLVLVLVLLSVAVAGQVALRRQRTVAAPALAEGAFAALGGLRSLAAEERREGLAKTMTVTVPEGTIHRFTLDDSSPAVGGTVVTLNIRAKTGASIVSVIRAGVTTRNIGPEWEFAVGDTLVALGDARQTAALKDLLGVTA